MIHQVKNYLMRHLKQKVKKKQKKLVRLDLKKKVTVNIHIAVYHQMQNSFYFIVTMLKNRLALPGVYLDDFLFGFKYWCSFFQKGRYTFFMIFCILQFPLCLLFFS